jgi:hypothetical protein
MNPWRKSCCKPRYPGTTGLYVVRWDTTRHPNGAEIVLCSPPNAPKMKVLAQDTQVALTIDYEAWPARVLLIRGSAHSQAVDGEIPEYAAITKRYLGEEGSQGWRTQYAQMFPSPVRITIKPEWVALIDVQTRFPSAIEAAMAGKRCKEQ